MTMSQDEIKTRIRYRNEFRKQQDRSYSEGVGRGRRAIESAAHSKPLPPKHLEADPTLTIQLRESTLEGVREVSWEESRNGSGDFTYDQILLFLIETYHHCVRNHQQWQRYHSHT